MSAGRDDFIIAVRSALLQKGARQKFSLFFLIIFSILILFLDNLPGNIMKSSRSFLNDSIYRVSHVATSPFKLFSFFGDKIETHFLVYEENKILKKRLQDLERKDFQTVFLTTENKNLKKIIDNENKRIAKTVLAKVLLDKESPFLKSIIVNKGSRSGARKGMPVLDGNYLVGKIVEVNYLSSRVLLLNDLNSKIPITIANTEAQGILSGTGKQTPILNYLPEFYIGEENSVVFTSGKDGIFPSGIPIGAINRSESDKVIYNVKLFSDPNQLSFVNIVLEISEEEESRL